MMIRTSVLFGCRRSFPTLLLAFGLASPSLSAQVVRGTVRDDADRPVPSALVTLVDRPGSSAAITMTDAEGGYAVRAQRAGAFRLRVQRIGYTAHLTGEFELQLGESRIVPIRLAGARVSLAAVNVSAAGTCSRVGDRDADPGAIALWEQASAALQVAVLSMSADLRATTISIDRTLDRRGRRVLAQRAEVRTARVTQPWRAWDYRALRAYGFVHEEPDGLVAFQAPGLDAMVSPLFLEDHCLRPLHADRPGDATLAFEPIAERRTLSEVRGLLVLDRASAELRRLELRYLNVPIDSRGTEVEFGAELEFVRLPDGRFIIARWVIRMPRLELPTATSPRAVVAAVVTAGGDVVTVTRGGDTLYVRPPITVTGVVADSATAHPVPRARVALDGVAGEVHADERGRFTLADVLPGEYSLIVRTPSLDSIGSRHEEVLVVTDGAEVTVRVPNASDFITAACGSALGGGSVKGRGLLLGTVRDLAGGDPEPGILVEADWREFEMNPTQNLILSLRRGRTARTDSAGRFRLCGVATESDVWLRASPDSGRGEWVQLRLEPDRRAASADLRVDWSASPWAQFRGVVTADSTGIPLVGVEVSLPDAGLSARTDSSGAFRLVRVPPGNHRVIVRRVGSAAYESEVALGEKDEEERRIVLSDVTQLAQVTVLSTVLEAAMREFAEHRRVGLGSFVTRDELKRYEGLRTANAIAGFRGLSVVGGGNAKFAKSRRETLTARRYMECQGDAPLPGSPVYVPSTAEKRRGIECACYAQVYVDGIRQNPGSPAEPFDLNSIPPEEIEAIEWYSSPAETPVRYAGLNSACGVVVIHRRRDPA